MGELDLGPIEERCRVILTSRALEWSLNQDFPSVAATYARTLAESLEPIARTDLPACVEEIKRLREEVYLLHTKYRTFGECVKVCNENAALRARVKELEEALASYAEVQFLDRRKPRV